MSTSFATDANLSLFENIDPLEKTNLNYKAWSIRMMAALSECHCDGIVSGQEQRPTGDKDAAELWDAKNQFALRRIIMGVSDRDVVKIARLSTAAEAWKTLEENYKMGERASKIGIYRRLRDLRMAEGSCVRDYIDNFEEIIMEATNLNMYFTSDDEDLGLRLLSGLPPSFDDFVERFIYQCQEGREALTLQSVKRSLVTLSTLANV